MRNCYPFVNNYSNVSLFVIMCLYLIPHHFMTRRWKMESVGCREHYHNQTITSPVSRMAQPSATPGLLMVTRAPISRSTSAVGNAPVLTSGQKAGSAATSPGPFHQSAE